MFDSNSSLEWKEYVGFTSVSPASNGYYFKFPRHLGTRASSELTINSDGYITSANSVTQEQVNKSVEYLKWQDAAIEKINQQENGVK